MKRHITHILTAAAALLAVLGCTKNEPNTNGRLITMTAHEAGATKALLEADSFMAAGNQIVVYDYYTAPNDVQNPNPATGYYIPGVTAQSTGATDAGTVWPFLGDARYEWTDAGTHKFFGWMVKDNNENPALTASGFFGNGFGFTQATHTLTIPTTTLSQSSDQFDFMYSNITPREPATEGFDPVPLEFKHLFTAFGIIAKDVAEFRDYAIDYIEFKGMVETNSATIVFPIDESTDEPTVTYGTGTPGDSPYRITFTDGLHLTDSYKDLFSTEGNLGQNTSNRKYMLAWPQAARAIELNIGYRAKEINDTEYESYTKKITLTSAWLAGQKNNLNIDFKDKEITLNYLVEPWNVQTEEVDFSDQVTVDENDTITWDLSTVDDVDYSTGKVLLYDDPNVEAMCTFTILTPKGATWTASLISLEGHPDAFRFVGGTKYGTVGVRDTIKLAVTNQDPISPRHVCELLITVQTADGRTIVVDDALTPERDEEGNETTYSRFQIIQNLINQ